MTYKFRIPMTTLNLVWLCTNWAESEQFRNEWAKLCEENPRLPTITDGAH